MIANCAERESPERSLLGREQERWLAAGLASSATRWNVLAQQMLIASNRTPRPEGNAYWSDGWDGYPATRQRILDHVRKLGLGNVVTIGGDIHAFWAADLKEDFTNPASSTVASEFVGSSITSYSRAHEAFVRAMAYNPHLKFVDARVRGYVRVELTGQQWRCDFQALEYPVRQDALARTLASFAVEHGRPGVQRIG